MITVFIVLGHNVWTSGKLSQISAYDELKSACVFRWKSFVRAPPCRRGTGRRSRTARTTSAAESRPEQGQCIRRSPDGTACRRRPTPACSWSARTFGSARRSAAGTSANWGSVRTAFLADRSVFRYWHTYRVGRRSRLPWAERPTAD